MQFHIGYNPGSAKANSPKDIEITPFIASVEAAFIHHLFAVESPAFRIKNIILPFADVVVHQRCHIELEMVSRERLVHH